MSTLPLTYHGISVESDRLDRETRRREQIPAQAVLRVSNGKTIRDIPLSDDELVALIEASGVALARVRKVRKVRAERRHDHEAWQIRESAKGGRYCAACGQDIPEP
jgi:hypothetical protein